MNRITRLTRASVLLALLLGAGACAKDTRPKYVVPQLAKDQYARIQATIGPFSGVKAEVQEVDGARVDGLFTRAETPVAPGEHVIGVKVYQGGYSMGAHTMGEGMLRFRYTFLAGHMYEVDFNTRGDRRPIMRDKTGRKMIYLDEPPQLVEPLRSGPG